MRHYSLSRVQADLLKKNIIDLQGDVDGDMVLYVHDALAELIAKGSPNIDVLISSGGGKVLAGLDICDLLRFYKGKKTGIILCYAKSMAAIILQVCDKRLCAKHARVLIHHINGGSFTLDQLRSKKTMKAIKRGMERDQAQLYSILAEKTGQSRKKIVKACRKDRDMSAREALKFGLIDEII